MKSLADILSQDDTNTETYLSDQKKRYWRSQKGQYSRKPGVFSFIHLMQQWETIVGEFMASNTLPLKIKNKNLIVSTKHSIFAQELGFLVPEILKKIKERFPELSQQITHIKFLHHTSFQTAPPGPSNQKVARKLHPQSPQYKQLEKKAQQLTQDLSDPEVIAAIKDFILN